MTDPPPPAAVATAVVKEKQGNDNDPKEEEEEVDHFPHRLETQGRLVVKASDAIVGTFGLDRVHAQGTTMRMREWKHVPVGFSFAAHDYEADIIGFVTQGKAVWTLDGVPYTLEKGDSYYLPQGCMYAVQQVLEEFESVEVTTQGAKLE